MKIGLKTYGELETLKTFQNKVDFFEVMALNKPHEGSLELLKKLTIPLLVHSAHGGFGINNADKLKEAQNLAALEKAAQLADMLGSPKIIVHPGEIESPSCNTETSENLITNFKDSRILIENMPHRNGISLCSTPENTREYLTQTKCGFCLDINHAISAALELKIDYIQFLSKFIELKPAHYHLGGQRLTNEDRAHRCFMDSDIDLAKILSLLPKDCEISLEVTMDLEKTKRDVEIIKQLVANELSKRL